MDWMKRSRRAVAAMFWARAKSNKEKSFPLFLADLEYLRCLLRKMNLEP
jgi:hypothetical protein